MFLEFEKISLEKRKKKFDKSLKKAKKRVKSLLSQKERSFEGFVLPLWMINERLGWDFHPLSHLNSVQNGKKIQKIYPQALEDLTKYYTKLMQNEEVYQAFVSIKESESYVYLLEDQKKGIEDALLDFQLSGVGLSVELKKRVAEIDLRLSHLTTQFSQNVLDDTNAFSLCATSDDVQELSQTDKEVASDGKGGYKFTLKYPSYVAYMTYGNNRSLREELYKAYVTRGEKNQPLIDEILALRDEKGKILGFSSFADLSIATKDAPSSRDVITFLDDLADVSYPFAKREYEDLCVYGKSLGLENLESFDTAYVAEKMRKELYDIDEELYRPYFEQKRVVEGMMNFVSSMFGVTINKAKCKRWDKKVMVYEFEREKKVFARLYLDLEARDDKKGGAWMDNWTSHAIDEEGNEILPIAFIVCNFPPSTKQTPSLLKHSDVETLFHEMGHAIHHLFSTVSSVVTSGVNGVCWDVVEFPSQFLENFVFDREVLATFAHHYQTGEVIPSSMVDRLKRGKNFHAAMMMIRQLEFSLFDFHVHKNLYQGEEILDLIKAIREKISVVTPPSYNKFHHSFTHIFSGGYAAGYYSYKWAEVLSAHLYLLMQDVEQREMLAQKYRDLVLSLGGSRSMNEMFKEVTGADKDPKKLLELYGLL